MIHSIVARRPTGQIRLSILALAAAGIATLASPLTSYASLNYGTPDATINEDFNSLPITPENVSLQATKPWTNDANSTATTTGIAGWYLYHPTAQATEGGSDQHSRFRISSTGSSSTGSFYSFGPSSSSTNRSLGDTGSNTTAADGNDGEVAHTLFYAVRLTNNTGQVLDTIKVGYTGEQWRYGGNATDTDRLDVAYSLTATAISDPTSSFTAIPALKFTPATTTGSATQLDGTAAANQTVFGPVSISGLSWQPGTDLWIRWGDPEIAGNDDSLAIDNFNFSASNTSGPNAPEPSGLALIGLTGIGFAPSPTRDSLK